VQKRGIGTRAMTGQFQWAPEAPASCCCSKETHDGHASVLWSVVGQEMLAGSLRA